MGNLYVSWANTSKTRRFLRSLTLLISLCFTFIVSEAQNFASTVTSQSGITSADNALNGPDGNGAQLYENGDVLTLQLDATIPSGTPYYIRWKKRAGETGNARPVVRESSTGGSWTDNTSLVESGSTDYVTMTYTSMVQANYIQITKTSAFPADFEIDAIITLQVAAPASVSSTCDIVGFESNTGRILWIPNFGTDYRASGATGLKIIRYSNGKAYMTGILEKISDTNKKMLVSIWFNNESNFSSWTSQGNIAHSPNLGDESTWMFYDFDLSKTNQIIGLGSLNTTLLNIFPQVSSGSLNPCNPNECVFNQSASNFQYGLQLGQGANAQDGDFGISSWFVYNGTSCGNGDFNGNLINCAATCSNLTHGGTIGSNQTGCTPFDPATINNVTLPSGGSGTIEYMWLYKSASTGWALWTIPNASAASYDPGALTETTTFRRCARRSGCTSWDGESNDITITVNNCCDNVNNGGSICCDQTGCGPNFDPAVIQSYTAPTGGTGTLQYMWLYKNASTNWVFQEVVGANGETYDPGVLTQNTTFRRCARRSGCTTWDGESNDITIYLENCCDGIELDIWDNANSCLICSESFTSSINSSYINGNKDVVSYTDPNCNPNQCLTGLTITFNVAAADFDLSQNSAYVDQISYNYPIELNGVVIGYFNPTEIPYTCNVCEPSGNRVKTFYFDAAAVGYNYGGQNTLDLNFRSFGLQQGQVQDVCVGNILLDFIYGTCCETVPPVFSNVPANVSVQCASAIPAVTNPTATDNSGNNPTITFVQDTIINGVPVQICQISDANDHTLWVSNPVKNALGLTNNNFVSEGVGTFELYPDGTAKLTGIVKSAQVSTKKFQYTAWYRFKRTFEEWTSIPSSSTASGFREEKLDAGTTVTITDEYLDWSYFELDPTKTNTLVGLNSLNGVTLTVQHYPTDYSFAGQLGDKASLQSTGYGFSAWINIVGYIGNTYVCDPGDFNIDLNNCQDNNPVVECDDTYIIRRTWTATDDCFNSATAQQLITVTGDNQAPVLNGLPQSATAVCGSLPTPNNFNVTASDNCDNSVSVQVSFVDSGNSSTCDVVRTFTWTATDDCGNTVTATRTFSVDDNTAPTFDQGVENITVQCQNDIPSAESLTASDNCDQDVTVTLTETISGVDSGDVDVCFIDDTNAGHTLWVSNPVKNALGVSSNNFVSVGNGTFERFDDGTLKVTGLVQSSSHSNKKLVYTAWYRFKRDYATWHAIPNSNTASGFREAKVDMGNTITIGNEFLDWEYYELDPTKTNNLVGQESLAGVNLQITHFPADYRFGGQYGENASLQSNGPGFSAWILIQGTANGNYICDQGDFNFALSGCEDENPTVDCNDQYQITRTWTATDDCGNSTSVSQVVSVTGDTEAPTFDNLPANGTVVCDELPTGDELAVTASDNCDEAVIVITTFVDNGEGCDLTRTYTFVATDDCGNVTTAVRTLSTHDDEEPTFVNLPENGTVLCGQLPDPANYYVDAEDNCTANPTVTFNINDQGNGCERTRIITWTATDDCGNQAVASRTFYLSDSEDPTFDNIPANTTLECGEEVENIFVTASDNCDEDVFVDMVAETVELECGYQFIRTWTAVDDCGNTTVASQTITFVDTTKPFVTYEPQDVTYSCTQDIPYDAATFGDVCDTELEVVYSSQEVPFGCSYKIIRTWVATDDCGNSETATQVVFVVDETDPTLVNVPADVTVECTAVPAVPTNVYAQDICDDQVTVTFNETIEYLTCGYVITRTWTATDDCGNQDVKSQMITVIDTTNPVVSNVPADAIVSCDNIPNASTSVVAQDLCSGALTPVFTEEIVPGVPGTLNCTYNIIRRWTATDACGNIAVGTQVLTVIDNVAPQLGDVPANTSAECSSIPVAPMIYGIDNCSETPILATLNESIVPVNNCTYNVVRVWTVSDDCGNTAQATQIISVTDNTNPYFNNAPANVTVECGQVPAIPSVTAGDACDMDVTVDFFEMVGTGCPYTITRMWIATDDCGNMAMHTQVITVVDTTAPYTTSTPAVELTAGCLDIVPVIAPVFADACDTQVYVNYTFQQANQTACGYDIVRTWTATDDCGNVATFTQTIHVIDNQNPTLVGVPANTTVSCNNIPAPSNVTATDVCSSATVSMEEVVSEGCPYTITRTWTATDVCGNSSSATQVITVIDNTPPTFVNVPANVTVECTNVPGAELVSATDNCGGLVTVTVEDEITSGYCTYYIYRTYTATDLCGNVAEATQILMVVDTTNPELDNVPANITVQCGEVPAPAMVTATDNCSEELEIVFSQDSIAQNCGYVIIRTWSVDDYCGNNATATQTITVTDYTNPTVDFSAENLTIECGEDVVFTAPIFSDNCDLDLNVTFVTVDSPLACGYATTRTWTAIDDCGNDISVSQTITVVDTTAPYIVSSPAAEVTVECGNPLPTEAPVFGDVCDEELSIIAISGENNVTDCGYDVEKVWTATDNCGNSFSFTQVIHVVDTTAPSFGQIPANVTVECSSMPAPAMVTATDVCSDVVVTVNDVTLPTVDCQYQIIRTWTATDVCGNYATAAQTITVIDTTAPVISGVNTEMTLECNVQPSIIAPTAEDNCDETVELVFSSQDFPGVCENSWTTVYTWTASDDCGNTSVRTMTFHFQDTTDPTFDTMLSNMTVECDMVPAAAVVTASDNCDDNVVVTMEESMTEGCNYVITRTYTAVDNCGNESVMVQIINVEDTTAPELSGVPANTTIECGTQLPTAFVTAEDNCDETLQVSMNTQTIDGECTSQVIRTWSVTDDCGNTATATQTITITDTTAPYIVSSPAAEVTVECGNPLPTEAPVFGDVCDEELSIIAISGENNVTDCGYDVEKVWTATDNCGNSFSFTQVIHVVDTTAPSFGQIPANVTVECSSIPAPAMVTATDVCSDVVVTVNDVTLPTVDCQYQIIRTWTATDVCGNYATAVQTLTVIDTTAPVISGVNTEMTLECNVQPSIIAPTAEDNCDETVELVFSSQDFPGVCENSWTTVYTWTASDDCGNTSVRTMTFHFQDTTDPTFDTMLSNMTVECDMVPAAAVVTASDNCDDNVVVTMEESMTEGCPYSITRVYTATDNCGNIATMTQVITVIDTIDPELVGVPANVTIECSDDLPMANVTATDSCTEVLEVEMSVETNTFECGSEVVRTWTVADACGNTATATQTITITDTTAPYLTSNEEEVIEVECDQVIPAFNPTFGDACDMNLDITSTSEEVNINSCGYDVVRSVTATDNCGNAITVTQTVQVRDTQAPVITGIIDIEAECDADVATLVTVEDNCDETPELTYVDFLVSGGSCQGRIIRMYTATDDCGNTSTFEQIIWLLDTTAPTVEEEPADVVIECGDAIPSFEAIFSDNCDDELNITFNESTVPAECGYAIYRVWTATDNCQNTLVVDQLITITDLTNPVLYNVPADVTIECGNDIPAISTDVYATDNCVEDVNILVTEETVDLACGYQIVRMYRAYDDCGNSAMATQTITIVDTTVPVLSGSAPSVSVLCGDVPSVPVITAFDSCDGVVPVQFSEITSTGCPYTITRTWTATDACGNAASITQVITVTDEVAPQFVNNPVWIQIECSELSGYSIQATDNCDNDVEVSIIEELVFSGGCFGNIQRTYEAVDNCGNSVIFIQIIQLVDTQAPVIENVPVETTIYCDAEIPAVPSNIFGTDNCDTDVEIFFTQTQTNEFCPYDIIRTWTALDECGNETVETQVIHVTVEIPQLISVQTYPNPTDGDFTFEFSTPKDAIVYGALYDMTGREVLPLMNGKADGGRLYKFVVNGQKMNAGSYTVMMKVDGEVLRNRVVITGK